MSNRQEWVDAILASEAGRYLFARGGAQHSDTSDTGEQELSCFFSKLKQKQYDPSILCRLRYITLPLLVDFVSSHLKELLRSASHQTTNATSIDRAAVRGKIDWQKTSVMRSSCRIDRSSFVTRKLIKTSDTPENRLLKSFLWHVSATVKAVRGQTNSGKLFQEINEIGRLCDQFLRDPYLREVQKENKITVHMRNRACRNRDWRYRRLATLQKLFEEALDESKWAAIYDLLKAGWLEPVDIDDIYELYCVIKTIEIIRDEVRFGDIKEYGLIRKDRDSIATFANNKGETLDIFFDTSPVKFAQIQSKYLDLTSAYGIKSNPRRPDICLRYTNKETRNYFFIEIKKTHSKEYLRDSVYKAYGYLCDFETLWDNSMKGPKIVILVPQKIRETPSLKGYSYDVTLASTDDCLYLKELIADFIANS